MLTKCQQNVMKLSVCCWFLKNVLWHNNQHFRIHVCEMYQRTTPRNKILAFVTFYCILELSMAWLVHCTKKIKTCLAILFSLNFGIFQDFSIMLTECHLSWDVFFNFALLQKTTIPTKSIRIIMGCDAVNFFVITYFFAWSLLSRGLFILMIVQKLEIGS